MGIYLESQGSKYVYWDVGDIEDKLRKYAYTLFWVDYEVDNIKDYEKRIMFIYEPKPIKRKWGERLDTATFLCPCGCGAMKKLWIFASNSWIYNLINEDGRPTIYANITVEECGSEFTFLRGVPVFTKKNGIFSTEYTY